jgi:hypothetical protein
MTMYYVDKNSKFAGVFVGHNDHNGTYVSPEVPEGLVEVPSAPLDARQVWENGAWANLPRDVVIKDRLAVLSNDLPRVLEDVIVAVELQTFGATKSALEEKQALRAELAAL